MGGSNMNKLTKKEIQSAINVLNRMKEEINGNYCGSVFFHGESMSKALLADTEKLLISRRDFIKEA